MTRLRATLAALRCICGANTGGGLRASFPVCLSLPEHRR